VTERARGERVLTLRGKRRRVRVSGVRARHRSDDRVFHEPRCAAKRRREDGQSRVRIRKVQSCVAETVGMGHHGRTALVYAGNISWK